MDGYPPAARTLLGQVRDLVCSVAGELDIKLEETLKWGEPSFLAKGGSTLRMAFKASEDGQCMLYVNCQTRLIETFREIYPDTFRYEGKRAVQLPMDRPLPEGPLRQMIAMTLTYHKVKHLPLLGA